MVKDRSRFVLGGEMPSEGCVRLKVSYHAGQLKVDCSDVHSITGIPWPS